MQGTSSREGRVSELFGGDYRKFGIVGCEAICNSIEVHRDVCWRPN